MNAKTKTLFEELEDETETSTGKEIGEAISEVVKGIGKSNEKLVVALTQAMKEALLSVDSKRVVVENNQVEQPQQVKKWTFNIERNAEGFMTKIVAEADDG